MNQKLIFLSNFLKNPKEVAAIAQSSRYVINNITENIDFSKAQNIVEYGPGTGIVTRSLLPKMNKGANLFCFESNPDFCSFLRGNISDARLKVINGSAESLDTHLKSFKIKNVDYILSGIPFSLIDQESKQSILAKTRESLAENGKFIVYQQYNWHMSKHLKNHFGRVSMKIEFRNLPPTFIFVCRKNEAKN